MHPLIAASSKGLEAELQKAPEARAWYRAYTAPFEPYLTSGPMTDADRTRRREIDGAYRAWQMHAPRYLNALINGRDIPVKATATQRRDGVKDEHITQLNVVFGAVMDRWLREMARDLGRLAVLFSDPDDVSALVRRPNS